MDKNEGAGAAGSGPAEQEPDARLGVAPDGEEDPGRGRILAALGAARYHGYEPDPNDFHNTTESDVPSPADLVEWLREAGLWARASRMSWRQLMKLSDPTPVVLFFNGRMSDFVLDIFMLIVPLPILFSMSAALGFVDLAAAIVITLIVVPFMPALRRIAGHVVRPHGFVRIATEHLLRPDQTHPEFFNNGEIEYNVFSTSPEITLVGGIKPALSREFLIDRICFAGDTIRRRRRPLVQNNGNVEWASLIVFLQKCQPADSTR